MEQLLTEYGPLGIITALEASALVYLFKLALRCERRAARFKGALEEMGHPLGDEE